MPSDCCSSSLPSAFGTQQVRRDPEGAPAGGIDRAEIGLDVLDADAALRQDVGELADDADPVVADSSSETPRMPAGT